MQRDLEGWEVYYVIDKVQRGFSKITGCHTDKGVPVDACLFADRESAERFMKSIEYPYLEVRRCWIPYKEEMP